MAKLPTYRRLIKTDFDPKYQDLIDQLGQTINAAFDQVFSALNHNITIPDNLNATLNTFTVIVDSTNTPTATTSFKLASYQTTVNGFIVLNAVGADNTIVPTGPVQITKWNKSNNIVTINTITGLMTGKQYTITVLVL